MRYKSKQFFAAGGTLSQAIPGYQPRQAQIDMACAVESAVKLKQKVIIEAGTGTGKTFAYLAPAMLSGQKTIISTGTKNLQEQLFHRDMPVVKEALASNLQVALLKGRSNYLCTYRMKKNTGSSAMFKDKNTLAELKPVRDWAESTKSGDIGELQALSEDASIIPLVTSTADNCLGRDCPDYESCYVVKARTEAMDADVVVVNHHLFFADLALKDTGFGELIPEAQTIIFDEAHQIPDIASEYFGITFSTRTLHDAARDITQVYRSALKDIEQIDRLAQKMATHAADFRILFGATEYAGQREQNQRGKWRDACRNMAIPEQISRISEALDETVNAIKQQLGRDKALDNIYERLVQAKCALKDTTDVSQSNVSLWYETTPKQVVLHQTPLNIADKFAELTQTPLRPWIFTSATLMVNGHFEHFQRLLGLHSADTLVLDSPFAYETQSVFCVPRDLPEPSDPRMLDKIVEVATQLIVAAQGRCFLLFTSHAMLRRVAEALTGRVPNPLLVQGTSSKQALLDTYISEPGAVLLATGAFWEGVDVRGDDLVCVLIDKLPFASPDDPLLQAKIEDCQKRGGNAFMDIQIPQAVISLKQGAGRLIRDVTDKGVLVICDTRLVTKNYGSIFISSLPNMHRTRDLAQACDFLTKLSS
jgi:ATP-dependent DNA helicase DinG